MNAQQLEDRLLFFGVNVCKIADTLPSTRIGNHVVGQIIRSSTSPAPNYAEGRGAESRKDFLHKIKLVLKELRETTVWLRFIIHMEMVPSTSIDPLLHEGNELVAIFVATSKSLQAKK